MINNLIVIPLELNGKELSFIFDSGVTRTILFKISENDSIGLNDIEKVMLQGLGKGDPIEAFLSRKNNISIKNLVSNNETIYAILDDHFDLSSKMGTTIHGIIGYNLLKNFIVKINYGSKKIDFYNPKTYKYKKCRKCEVFALELNRKKPYIDLKVQIDTVIDKLTDVKLLIDSGGSDAIWLFENSKEEIKTPKLFFKDILGEGLSGPIYGNRSRIPKIKLGSFEIKNPTVSFLDTISTKNARGFRKRNGSIGGAILNKFIVWFDYPHRQLRLKKNASFSKGFNYNMTGLDVVYSGKQLVREQVVKTYKDGYNNKLEEKNTASLITNYLYKFKPSFKIKSVLKNSPAEKVGLLKDDIILSINNIQSHRLNLNEITLKFQERDNKKIKIIIERNGKKMKFEFRLEKKI
ncbi:aspartyl protease family protein [Polaribacter glomeratus]|uniref:aspartyl protease family protein n=1 Tax=Polaribacter glomeratus TaxID=102 RepID=UPI0020121A85|nr:aspartyl protease family protein [Polaribacter glomeratus]